LEGPLVFLTYHEEIGKVRTIVEQFMELREQRGSAGAEKKALELDDLINSLNLVKQNCNQPISSLDLAFEADPYSKLQQTCPPLKSVEFSKAVEMWSRFT
jgi:hypothetical protein